VAITGANMVDTAIGWGRKRSEGLVDRRAFSFLVVVPLPVPLPLPVLIVVREVDGIGVINSL